MTSPDGTNQPLVNGRSTPPLDQTPVNGPLALHGFPGGNGLLLPPGQSVSPSPTISTLLMALKRRWLLAGVLGFIAAVVGVIGVLVAFPPKFVTKARVELARPSRVGI